MAHDKRRKQQQFSFTWDDSADPAPPRRAEPQPSLNKQPQDPPMLTPPENSPDESNSQSTPETEENSSAPASASSTQSEETANLRPQSGALGTPRPRPSVDTPSDDTPKAELPPDALSELTVGQIMQEARGQVNRSIAQVAQRTRIPPSFLYNLEADHLDRLPALIYSKSHVRHLCGDYGLDPEPVLGKFLAAVGAEPPKRKSRSMTIRSDADDENSRVAYHLPPDEDVTENTGRFGNIPVRVIGAGLGALALLLVLVMVVQALRSGETDEEASSTSATTTAPADLDYERFVVPQVLPIKQLPMPGDSD